MICDFNVGDRVIVVAEEPDEQLRDDGAGIPIGTTGTVESIGSGDTNPATGEEEPFVTVVFDLPHFGNRHHFNHNGFVKFDMFASMIEPYDEGFSAVDLSGLFD